MKINVILHINTFIVAARDRQTHRQTDRQTRQTDRQTDRQTHRQTDRDVQIGKYTSHTRSIHIPYYIQIHTPHTHTFTPHTFTPHTCACTHTHMQTHHTHKSNAQIKITLVK